VWVKFPFATSIQKYYRDTASAAIQEAEFVKALGSTAWSERGHLDHHALDTSRQSRHQFLPKIGYGLYEVTNAPEGNWAKSGDKFNFGR